MLWLVIIRVKNAHPSDDISWDTYIIQDWGQDDCSNGTRVDDKELCQIAFDMYQHACGTLDEDIDTERMDGPQGCQVEKDLGIVNFHFNRNIKGGGDAAHAPVCNVSQSQQAKCYDESRQEVMDIAGGAAFFLSFIPAAFMVGTRCCAPACHHPHRDEDCNRYCARCVDDICCNCFAHLDTPYLTAGCIMFVVGGVLGRGAEVPTLQDIGPAPMAWLLGVVLNIAALVTACVKLCLMLGCCGQGWLMVAKTSCCRVVDAVPPVPHMQPGGEQVVIGQPVTVQAQLKS